jgi:hypothetical protein
VLRGAVLPLLLPFGGSRSPSAPGAVLFEPFMSWLLPEGAVVAVEPPALPLVVFPRVVFLLSEAQPARASPNSAIQTSLLMKCLLKKV